MKFWNFAALSLTLIPLSAQANTSIDGANRFTGGLLLQDTDYKPDNGDSFSVDGQLLVGGYKAAITPRFAIGGGVGIMFDGELGNGNTIGDGQGFRLFGDAFYEAHRFNSNKILITGTLSHDRFSFKESGVDADFTITELKGGALIMHDVRDFSLYAGLEVVIYSDGEVKTEVANNSFTTDVDRDDRLNLRLGAAFNATPNVSIKADLLLIGEQTILLGADFAL